MRRVQLHVILCCTLLMVLSMLCGSAFAQSFGAMESTSGGSSIKSGPDGKGQDEGTYTQQFISEESGQGCFLSGPGIDWRGDYYFVKRNAAGTESYLFKNYSPTNKTTPFITVSGKITNWSVTPDENITYFYYKLNGKEGMYRLPLSQGASGAEYKEFEFEGDRFLFNSFTLTDDPDKFLLMSPHDNDLNVTIGLFSFSGGTTPSATWTATLPQAWKSNFEEIVVGNIGYHIVFEATTDRLWLIAQRTYHESGARTNHHYWFFTRKISDPGVLTEYLPASEVPAWNEGNYKHLYINRYSRLIVENDGYLAKDRIKRINEFDPVAKKISDEALTQWRDTTGTVRPIGDFLEIGRSYSTYQFNFTMDAQKNIYSMIAGIPSSTTQWDALFQRFIRFNPAQPIEQPEPDPSIVNVEFSNPDDITLRASAFRGPSGYRATSSRWRIYKESADGLKGASALIHDANQTGAGNTYKIPAGVLEDGATYTWQMSYDWEYASASETVRGATNWSAPTSFTVKSGGGSTGGSSGGCNATAMPLFGAFLLASLARSRKGKKSS